MFRKSHNLTFCCCSKTLPLQCPDIKRFVNISLPADFLEKYKVDMDNNGTQIHAMNSTRNEAALETQDFLPQEVDQLPHAGKDVLKRLLQVDPKKRIHSVMALQRIAMYKDFKIEAKHLLSITPMDIIRKDGIEIYTKEMADKALDEAAAKAFQDF